MIEITIKIDENSTVEEKMVVVNQLLNEIRQEFNDSGEGRIQGATGCGVLDDYELPLFANTSWQPSSMDC